MSPDRVFSGASPEEVAADLAPLLDFQREGVPLSDLELMVRHHLEPHLMRYDLPQFQSMFNALPEPGSALGARVALEWNQGVTNWQVSPGGAVLEELCMQSLCRLFGLADTADGTLMYCGTYANQQAIYMALHRHAEVRGFDLGSIGLAGFDDIERLALVASADAHFSLKHAARMLGLGDRCVITVDIDSNRRIDVTQLEEIARELRESRDVFCVVATAGTTSTGSVDPIPPVADIASELGCWLHVDGAYGLAYKLVPGYEHLFEGVDRADTLCWDPHKQFGVPIPSSVLFARRAEDLGRMALFSSYWNRPDSVTPDPGTKSVPSTRPLTALPLVTSIRHQGLDGMVARLRAPLRTMKEVAAFLDSQTDMELCHQPDTAILCFRVVPGGVDAAKVGALQNAVYEGIMREGERTISVTELDGVAALRLVAVDPTVTVEAVMETIEQVRRVAAMELLG